MNWRRRIHEVIYEADSPSGRLFDVVLIVCILLSVGMVMVDSLPDLDPELSRILWFAEIAFTALFSVEYILRIISVEKPWRYVRSFYGVVDLLAILPTWLMLMFTFNAHYLVVVRLLRVLRVFRILKLTLYLQEMEVLASALRASARKIFVFFFSILLLVVIFGTLMYIIESPKNPQFSSIPASIYWAVVTVTTVGYGDVVPISAFGKFLASFAMVFGYAVIAVPTGIVGVELRKAMSKGGNTQVCSSCVEDSHRDEAQYCWRCGNSLDRPSVKK